MLTLWHKFVASFQVKLQTSETVIWARIKALFGMLFLAVTTSGADLSQFLHAREVAVLQVVAAFLTLDGGFSEYLRRIKSGEPLEQPAPVQVQTPAPVAPPAAPAPVQEPPK